MGMPRTRVSEKRCHIPLVFNVKCTLSRIILMSILLLARDIVIYNVQISFLRLTLHQCDGCNNLPHGTLLFVN